MTHIIQVLNQQKQQLLNIIHWYTLVSATTKFTNNNLHNNVQFITYVSE